MSKHSLGSKPSAIPSIKVVGGIIIALTILTYCAETKAEEHQSVQAPQVSATDRYFISREIAKQHKFTMQPIQQRYIRLREEDPTKATKKLPKASISREEVKLHCGPTPSIDCVNKFYNQAFAR